MGFKEQYRGTLKRIWKILWQSSLILFISLCLFEMIYRFNWIDFYHTELEALNPIADLNLEKDKTILIFGDSFTSDPNSWTKIIRDSLPTYNIINSAVPGTTVLHQKLIFDDRVSRFKPDQIIIQLYVGNDLIDYNRPKNFSKISIFRNIYWWMSEYFLSLQYVNYKLGQFNAPDADTEPKNIDAFSVTVYNTRVKNYLEASPSIIQESIHLDDLYNHEFDQLTNDLVYMIKSYHKPIYIVVLPHCVQTNKSYFNNYISLGAKLDEDKISDFSFYSNLKTLEASHQNVKVLSPLTDFKESNEFLYFMNDPHLNSIGQGLLGKFILNQLAEN